MRIQSKLPLNRVETGTIHVETDDGVLLVGPFECRGKADNADAAAHGNAVRDPTKPYGDHPYGTYRVVSVTLNKPPAHSYGAAFILLDPLAGDALIGKQNGRTGLAIHGGNLAPDDTLRATDGCLRVSNYAVTAIADLVAVGDEYICERLVVSPETPKGDSP